MAVKDSITSNISNALKSKENQQTPWELKTTGLLTSIGKSLKLVVKQGRDAVRRQRDKDTFKLFSTMNKKLDAIKKNTRERTEKGIGIIKFLVMIFVGVLVKTVKTFSKTVGVFLKSVKWFGKQIMSLGIILKGWAKGLFNVFKESKFGQKIIFAQRKIWNAITKFFNKRMLRIQRIFNVRMGRIAQTVTKIIKPIRIFISTMGLALQLFLASSKKLNMLNNGLKTFANVVGKIIKPLTKIAKLGIGKGLSTIVNSIGSFVKFVKGVKVPKVGGIMGTLGNVFKKIGGMFNFLKKLKPLLAPVMGILGKVLFPIILVIDIVTGLSKASKWFDKKEGEATTLKEKVSAVMGQIISTFTFGLLSGEGVAKGFHKLLTKPSEFFKKDFPVLMKDAGERLITGLTKLGGWILDGIKKGIEFINSMVPVVIDGIANFFRSIDWVGVGQTVMDLLITGVGKVLDIIWTVLKNLPSMLVTLVTKLPPLLWEAFQAILGILWGAFSGLVGLVSDGLGEKMAGLFVGVGDMISDNVGKIKDTIVEKVKKGFDFTKKIGGIVMDKINGLWKWLRSKIRLPSWLGGSKAEDKTMTTTSTASFESKPLEDFNEEEKKARTKEIKDTQEAGGIVLDQTMTEQEQKGQFMNFLLNEFADTMAKKIGVSVKTDKDPSNIKVPLVKVM